jgi:hypothetical protein
MAGAKCWRQCQWQKFSHERRLAGSRAPATDIKIQSCVYELPGKEIKGADNDNPALHKGHIGLDMTRPLLSSKLLP